MNSSPSIANGSLDLTDGAEAKDPLSEFVLAIGAAAVAIVGLPDQIVLPDTIKSIVGAVFVAIALCLFIWRIRVESLSLRWSRALWVPIALAASASIGTFWAPMHSALADAARWFLLTILILVGINSFGFKSVKTIGYGIYFGVLISSLLALIEFWFDLGWFAAAAAPASTFGNRNYFAEFISVGLPFVFWIILKPTDFNKKFLQSVGFGLILLALLSTGTRSALLATAVGFFVSIIFVIKINANNLILKNNKNHYALIVFVPLLLIFSLGWIPSGNEKIINEDKLESRGLAPIERSYIRAKSLFVTDTYQDKSSFGSRRIAWVAGKRMIEDHLILGVGAGGWNTASPLYMPNGIEDEHVWMAHNEPVQLIAEYGLVGWASLGALLMLWVASIRLFYKNSENSIKNYYIDMWPAIVSVLTFFLVSLSGMPLHAATTVFLLGLCVSLLLIFHQFPSFLIINEFTESVYFNVAKVLSILLLIIVLWFSVQGFRSDSYVQHATKNLVILRSKKDDYSPGLMKILHADAILNLRQGLNIYPDHGYLILELNDIFSELGDYDSVLWLSQLMQATRPHVASVKCNMIRAYSNQRKFDNAEKMLTDLRVIQPEARCIPISEFILLIKRESYKGALEHGLILIDKLDGSTNPSEARYVVDMSYRSAIRIPDHESAIKILKIRLQRWPETQVASWTLIGLLLANQSVGVMSAEALDSFKRAMAAANSTEKASTLAKIPPAYQKYFN